ncbi:MAG: metalloregulator ArsR/SmtB family transcription factor [Actinomycetota bacterium]
MLDAVTNPRRREILRLVWDEERSAGEIAGHFDVSWPAISQNLGVLRRAGLVIERREATRRYYRADREAAGSLALVLEETWSRDLDRLKHAVEEQP